jgi:hypothetical protein
MQIDGALGRQVADCVPQAERACAVAVEPLRLALGLRAEGRSPARRRMLN